MRSALEIFSCCTIMRLPPKTASVCQFLTQKMLQPFIAPPYPPHLSPPDYFLFSKLKMKLKGLHITDVAEIQEAVTDELKTVQKVEFSAAFQKLFDCAKACMHANGAYFQFKKKNVCVFLMYLRFLNKNFWPALCMTCVFY